MPRAWLAALALVAWVASAHAAPAAPKTSRLPIVAVPYYTPPNYEDGLLAFGLVPQSAAFAQRSAELEPALRTFCEAGDARTAASALAQAKAQWARTAGAWDRLAIVAVGPLTERRSARQIDFTPVRPELIARAIRSAPADAAAMERIGTPAKGLPALEWLLWTQPVAPGSAACGYARQVALDIAREAAALQQAFGAPRAEAGESSEDAPAGLFAETLNQWLGGVESLRWKQMEKPLRASSAHAGERGFPREASGQTATSWQQQWQTLRTLAVASGPAPQPGQGLVSFETYLRGLGLNPLADRLAAQVRQVDAAMQGLAPRQPARMHAAAAQLAALKRLAEAEVAPALKVSIGFSDADGD